MRAHGLAAAESDRLAWLDVPPGLALVLLSAVGGHSVQPRRCASRRSVHACSAEADEQILSVVADRVALVVEHILVTLQKTRWTLSGAARGRQAPGLQTKHAAVPDEETRY
jgi:hypothetical protein